MILQNSDDMFEDIVGSRFTDVWKDRNKIQPEITNWVSTDWAKRRNQYLTFLIRIGNEGIVKRIIEIQNKLSAIPCVDPFPKDYFHITVKECGFLVESEKYEDDILIQNLENITSKAKEVAKTFDKFNVSLSKLNIFSDVVLIEVHDGDRIGELNKELQTISEIKKMKFDYPNLLPHISIAQFQNNQEFTRLISYLEKMRETEFGELTVDYIELVNAHLSRRYPTLKTIQAFQLR